MSDAPAGRGTETIALTRLYASIKPDSITIKPSRAALLGPFIQGVITVLIALAIGTWINTLPIWLLMVLLFVVIISGPTAILGVVYNVLGSAFLMERRKQTCRWQQGFLGLGLGTRELVPFDRIARIEVGSDFEDELNSGDLQDVVRWEIRLVKDNDRALEIASITAARPLADEALDRANRLAGALAEMCGQPVVLGAIPEWALVDYLDEEISEEAAPDGDGDETIEEQRGGA